MTASVKTLNDSERHMAKPNRGRKDDKGSKPKADRTGLQVGGYIDPDIRHALDRYLTETEPAPSITNVLEVALRRFLSSVGYWPPPPADNK